MKKILFIFILILHSNLNAGAQVTMIPDQTRIHIKTFSLQPLSGATVKLNGVEMMPCVKCLGYANCDGMYCANGQLFKSLNAYTRAWVEVRHPDYEVLADSVYALDEIVVASKEMDYVWLYNKRPCFIPEFTTLIIGGYPLDFDDILNSTGGTVVETYNPCNMGGLFQEPGSKYTFVLHPNIEQQTKFRNRLMGQTFPAVSFTGIPNSMTGIYPNIEIEVINYHRDQEVVNQILDKMQLDGKFVSWYHKQYGQTNTLHIQLAKGDELNGNSVIEEMMTMGYFAKPTQQIVTTICLD